MSSLNGSFTDVGSSVAILVGAGQSFALSLVEAGASPEWSVDLERSTTGGQSWGFVETFTTDQSAVSRSYEIAGLYRLRCTLFGEDTSSVTYTLAEAADILQTFDDMLAIKEDGIEVYGDVKGATATIAGAANAGSVAATGAVSGASVSATGAVSGASASITGEVVADSADLNSATVDELESDAVGVQGGDESGVEAMRFGTDVGEGAIFLAIDETFDLTDLGAKYVDMTTAVPDGSIIVCIAANIEEAITAGGTSVKVGIGTAADPDKYGLTADLAQNSKTLAGIDLTAVLSGAEQIQVGACLTDGSDLGDTNFSAGSVRVRIVCLAVGNLKDAS